VVSSVHLPALARRTRRNAKVVLTRATTMLPVANEARHTTTILPSACAVRTEDCTALRGPPTARPTQTAV
jgi:hypothetical protein